MDEYAMRTIMDILEEINQIGYEECDNVEKTGISVQGLSTDDEVAWVGGEENGRYESTGKQVPVLDRQSILDVKNKL
jgi:hypothetical protein